MTYFLFISELSYTSSGQMHARLNTHTHTRSDTHARMHTHAHFVRAPKPKYTIIEQKHKTKQSNNKQQQQKKGGGVGLEMTVVTKPHEASDPK